MPQTPDEILERQRLAGDQREDGLHERDEQFKPEKDKEQHENEAVALEKIHDAVGGLGRRQCGEGRFY